jgi:hypothetical protein
MTSAKNARVNSKEIPEVPKHLKHIPKRKRFGIEQWNEYHQKWCYRQWYLTAKARDQALEDFQKRTTMLTRTSLDTPVRKIDR